MRRALGGTVAVLAALALATAASAPAFAHSQLIASTPEEGAVLIELPAQFSVTLNERLLTDAGEAAFALRVRDDAGLYYGDGCLTIADATVSTPAAIGDAGDYTLEWQVVSADGHPVGGEIPFTWEPAPAFAPAIGSAAAPACGAEPQPGDASHHDDTTADDTVSEVAIGDVLWIVGAVLVLAVGITVALVASKRRD